MPTLASLTTPDPTSTAFLPLHTVQHPGAIDWAKRQKLNVTLFMPLLDTVQVQAGDSVIGSLPVNLAAQVCAKGAAYWHVCVALPAALRGKELSANELERLDARLERFQLQAIEQI